jgi:hypothetical protein
MCLHVVELSNAQNESPQFLLRVFLCVSDDIFFFAVVFALYLSERDEITDKRVSG